MAANTTGNNNTALGTSALNQNTTGSSNISIGYQSLYANTTGGNNTSIGYLSSQQNTTGAGNTAIGYNSLNLNTTGGNNVAIGNSALSYNTTANNNTAVGVSSLNANTTGTQNTALGINAGANITTGSGNTFLGVNSGTGITTGGNNTILGNAGTLSAALTGNIIFADGNGNTRLFSDANGLIGINQAVGSVPGGQIDIHTTQTYALVLNGLSTSNAYTAFSNASVGKWRIGNTYNAGANTFDIYNLGTSSNALSFNSTTNAATFGNTLTTGGKITANGGGILLDLFGGSDTFSRVTGNRGNGDNLHIANIEFYNSFSSRLVGEMRGITGIGGTQSNSGQLAFYTNNNGTYAEAMRISSIQNLLLGSTTDDTTNKLQVTGSATISGQITNSGYITDQFQKTVSAGGLFNLFSVSLGGVAQGGIIEFSFSFISVGNAYYGGMLVYDFYSINGTTIVTLRNSVGSNVIQSPSVSGGTTTFSMSLPSGSASIGNVNVRIMGNSNSNGNNNGITYTKL